MKAEKILFCCLLLCFLSPDSLFSGENHISGKETKRVSNLNTKAVILLNAGAIRTETVEAQSLRLPAGEFNGKRLHLIQFAGPIQPSWYDQLSNTGVKIVTYVPYYSYLVHGDSNSIAKVQKLAESAHVLWDGPFKEEYRIHPNAMPIDRLGNPRSLSTDMYAIQLVEDDEANVDTLRLIGMIQRENPRSISHELGYVNIKVRIPPEKIFDIARQPDVVSIHLAPIPKLMDERQDIILSGNLVGNNPGPAGYLNFLSSMGFTQAQFSASGFGVDVSDDGLDDGTTTPNNPALYELGNTANPDRVVYVRREPAGAGEIRGCDGHGNLNVHIIAGYNNLSGFPHEDASGYNYNLGVSPFVRVGSSVIFDQFGYTNPDFEDLQSRAYNDGMRISSNSWGSDDFGQYSIDSQRYDALVRDAQPAGSAIPNPGNQEMVIVFANGNAGPGAGSVGSPATGKNVLSVGAAENVHPFGGADGCGTGDADANSANDIVSFSSRGPCDDQRFKPDIVAPGTHVSGGVFPVASPPANGDADPCFMGAFVCGGVFPDIFFPPGQEWTTASSGTSHSCPAVAGGAALVRQHFINQGFNPPSPAMTKAYLMNSARYMTGAGANNTLPANSQGMGEMDLGFAFATKARILRDQLPGDIFTASGQTRNITGNVADVTKPFRVTLAWTDSPGPTVGNAFVNDLDLTVTVGGNTYKGNVFSGASSVTGGSADPRNNVESVFLPAGISGAFSITITATNIAGDGIPILGGSPIDQDFALVCHNCTTGCPTITVNPPTLPNGIIGNPYNQTITATGGSAPYTFTVSSGSLPTGLTLDPNTGVLSGTTTTGGTFNFNITATDSTTCTGVRSYSVTVGTCTFCDDFEDGVQPLWLIVKLNFIETGGNYVGTPTGRKAETLATPVFSGCQNCSVEATMQTAGGSFNKIWLLGWFVDKNNYIELLIKEENDRVILKQRIGHAVVAKAKALVTILPNTVYRFRVNFDGSTFTVFLDGNPTPIITLSPAGPVPLGSVGFRVKNTTGTFGEITVQ